MNADSSPTEHGDSTRPQPSENPADLGLLMLDLAEKYATLNETQRSEMAPLLGAIMNDAAGLRAEAPPAPGRDSPNHDTSPSLLARILSAIFGVASDEGFGNMLEVMKAVPNPHLKEAVEATAFFRQGADRTALAEMGFRERAQWFQQSIDRNAAENNKAAQVGERLAESRQRDLMAMAEVRLGGNGAY